MTCKGEFFNQAYLKILQNKSDDCPFKMSDFI